MKLTYSDMAFVPPIIVAVLWVVIGIAQLARYWRNSGGAWARMGRFLARPRVANWLIRRALRTPYSHLVGSKHGERVIEHGDTLLPGESVYMERYWLFNPYSREDNIPILRLTLKLFRRVWTLAFPISIRIHYIRREDSDRDLHDHPWNARTVILKGHYMEKRENPEFESMLPTTASNRRHLLMLRRPGATATLAFEKYHRIVDVGDKGCWTLFISGRYRGMWGFWDERQGRKIPWREYLARNVDQDAQ